MGRQRLEEGQIMLYRAHVDVHAQLPADSLSVSLNILHTGGARAWLDQYRFDVERGQVAGMLAHGSSEAFLRIAVGTGNAEALDLAERFAQGHPSDRMRLHAWGALASVAADRDAVWARAERGGVSWWRRARGSGRFWKKGRCEGHRPRAPVNVYVGSTGSAKALSLPRRRHDA
jgi:hypothetical protein